MKINSLSDLNAARDVFSGYIDRQKTRILVCAGTGCIASGALKVYGELVRLVRETGSLVNIELLAEDEHASGTSVVPTGCRGFCAAGPMVHIEPSNVLYTHVKPEDVAEILRAVERKEIVRRLVYRDPSTQEPYAHTDDSPFYRKQKRHILAHCGNLDPERIEEYIAVGGYQGIAKAITSMTPESVGEEVLASGLRGRGGGGFPTGKKWEFARKQKSDLKYIVCNGDEGDPGAFMNRSLLEGDPHRVLEGMMIAGFSIGASEGVFYVRAEYPLAVRRLRMAIQQAEEFGLLGENILGTGFSFHAIVREGAGAFVCGEETALLASVEGERGMPRPRPPFPAVSGLWGKPTIINNVETLGNLSMIILNGAAAFRANGTEKSPGTKTFALTGKVNNSGLVEIPMGATLRELIFDIGGGISDGKKFKAVQIGGPSGGCLPESLLDQPLDYDSLQSLGAMVGSGGIVVTDEENCIVEFARYFMEFIQHESCGKCVACREGTKQMLYLLNKIVSDQATLEDIDLLEEVALVVKDASLCGLGKTASNPVLSTLRYFREEYIAHVVDHRCPAGVCQAFRRFYIEAEKCRGCSLCSKVCPAGAISGKVKSPYTIDQEKCIHCGACVDSCRFAAIEVR